MIKKIEKAPQIRAFAATLPRQLYTPEAWVNASKQSLLIQQINLIKSSPLTLTGRGYWMLLECGGGLNQPTPSDHPKTLCKTKKFI